MDPGFCPAVAPSASQATKRLIAQREILIDVLQTWPPYSMRILPPSSVLLYRPTQVASYASHVPGTHACQARVSVAVARGHTRREAFVFAACALGAQASS